MQAMYQTMHSEGDKANAIAAEETFDGRSLMPHVQVIGNCIQRTQSKSLLDYGCGKAGADERATAQTPDGRTVKGLQAIWGLQTVRLFDPGVPSFAEFPTGKYDAVICTDVLEHITKEDMDWVVDEILSFANKFVFLNVACYPAMKTLPNGENAHITQESPGWWLDLVQGVKTAKYDALTIFLVIDDAEKNRIMIEF